MADDTDRTHSHNHETNAMDAAGTPHRAQPVSFGSFELIRLMGRGGAGQVWLGKHRGQGVDVAIKVMSARFTKGQIARIRFNNEVQTMAAMSHPHVVTIYDYGVVDDEMEEQSGGRIAADSPYLVMEHVPGGPLQNILPIHDFAVMRNILLQILDALAHAHARGVIHRDVKPGNVLLQALNRRKPIVKLADFGIAFALSEMDEPTRSRDASHSGSGRLRLWMAPDSQKRTSGRTDASTRGFLAGTPGYMAPEQIHGDTVNLGPWTDLYAVGCLAHRMATGNAPFRDSKGSLQQILDAHAYGVLPPPAWTLPVPGGFNEWLSILLAKAPWNRYQRAADAADALARLTPVTQVGPSGVPDSRRMAVQTGPTNDPELDPHKQTSPGTAAPSAPNTADQPSSVTDGVPTMATSTDEPRSDSYHSTMIEVAPKHRCRVPKTWRRARDTTPPTRLSGAGLALFGLRPAPFVGREQERDRLWQALRDAHAHMEPRIAAIHGPAGIGKSRLARWIAQRADELGCAEVLTVTHSNFPNPSDGLSPMLAKTLRCVGLSSDETFRQTLHVLSALATDRSRHDVEYLAMALTRLMAPDDKEDEPPKNRPDLFTAKETRFAVLADFFSLKARHRPLIFWLDDVQWGLETLELAHALLEGPRRISTLMLTTYRDETLAERSDERALIQKLLGNDQSLDLPLVPLDAAERLELVTGMLDIAPGLADDVATRTGGNPLFAVQLVGDLVERRALTPNRGEFTLKTGTKTSIPDNIHDLWKQRTARISKRFGRTTGQILELAAAIGIEVDRPTWRASAEQLGLSVPSGMTEHLILAGLANPTEDGWSFTHPMFRESLERAAKKEGRWRAEHLACAAGLTSLFGPSNPRFAEKLAGHYLAADEPDQAVAPLFLAAEEHLGQGRHGRAMELCRIREQILANASPRPEDDRAPKTWLLMAKIAFEQGNLSQSETLLTKAAQQLGETMRPLQADILRTRARLTRMQGNMKQALDVAEQAANAFRTVGDDDAAATCDVIAARLHYEVTGDHVPGLAMALDAKRRFEENDDEANLAEATYVYALLLLADGDEETAIEETHRATSSYRHVGNRFGEAACANFQGEVARQSERFNEAVEAYGRAARILESIGSEWTYVQQINMALTMVQSGRYDTGRTELRRLAKQEFSIKEAVTCYIDYARMVCAAHDQDWPAFDRFYASAERIQPETGRVDKDLAVLADLAGYLAAQAHDVHRAETAWNLSKAHWSALGGDLQVEAIDEQLAHLLGPST
ncbi:MAG: protein kinase [Deltaproteobacteria bacterium]|nr:protein kinase [Deltaproteobacteria bacterium]